MSLSWEQRARRVRAGEVELATAPIDIDATTYQAMFEAIFRHTADSIVLCDTVTGEYYEVSDMFCELSGYPREELLGRSSLTLSLVDPEGVRKRVETDGPARFRALYENRLTRKDGTMRWVQFSHQEVGERHTLVLIRDITEAKEMAESLRRLASTDPLTGVLNSSTFRESAGTALKRWPEAQLIVVDVDGLKLINDTWGHAAGDEAITAIASALTAVVGTEDLVGRLGGDEFAALLTGETEEPELTLRRVREAVTAIPLASADAMASASVGAASGRLAYPALEEAADAAMYEGKRNRPQATNVPVVAHQ